MQDSDMPFICRIFKYFNIIITIIIIINPTITAFIANFFHFIIYRLEVVGSRFKRTQIKRRIEQEFL